MQGLNSPIFQKFSNVKEIIYERVKYHVDTDE